MTPDLFNYQSNYPKTPGHRGVDTSIKAAESIGKVSVSIRERVYGRILTTGAHGMTIEEVCKSLAIAEKTGQPRVSELKALGKIFDSGQRRKNSSGVNAIVWVA